MQVRLELRFCAASTPGVTARAPLDMHAYASDQPAMRAQFGLKRCHFLIRVLESQHSDKSLLVQVKASLPTSVACRISTVLGSWRVWLADAGSEFISTETMLENIAE